MFKITDGKGYQITFKNGWTVSVQWGCGNYADNYITRSSEGTNASVGAKGSTTAEIAAWDADGRWHNFGTDTVKGYCTPDEVVGFVGMIAAK